MLVAEVAYTGHTGKVVAHRFPKGTGAGAVENAHAGLSQLYGIVYVARQDR